MWREGLRPPDPFRRPDAIEDARTQDGMSLRALSGLSPVLVVCLPEGRLRRRWLAHLAAERRGIESRGVRFFLVHGDAAELAAHGLEYVARTADDAGALRARLGLDAKVRRAPWAAPAALVAVLVDGEVRAEWRPDRRGALPDYAALTSASAAPPPAPE